MNGLKKFFGKDDIDVFESGKKSAEQAKQKARKPKSSRWKKYLAVGASLAILGFATPLNSEDSNAYASSDNIKSNKIELASNVTMEKGSVAQDVQQEKSYAVSMTEALGGFSEEATKLANKLHQTKFFENSEDKRPITYYDEKTGTVKTRNRKSSDRVADNFYMLQFLRPYLELPMGRELLETAVDSGFRLQMQTSTPFIKKDGSIEYEQYGANVDDKKKIITLMWPKGFNYKNGKDHINDEYLFITMASLGHELRHAWQITEGIKLTEKDNFRSCVIKERSREADASAMEAFMMWQFKDKYNWNEPIDICKKPTGKNAFYSDIYQAFEDNISKGEDVAITEAFKKWYTSDARKNTYDKLTWDYYKRKIFKEGENREDLNITVWADKFTIPNTGVVFSDDHYISDNILSEETKFFEKPETIRVNGSTTIKDKNQTTTIREDIKKYFLPKSETKDLDIDSNNNSQQTSFFQKKNQAKKRIVAYKNKAPNLSAIIQRRKLISHRRT